ncbi:uncharacterized protein LOC121517106 isoform X2 [Cheilinus undulatus]|uniref:uncharacterized protein LOC121517106 isoform X2 n=1 Tax=Cheilinus undulatus TaxID=241271 RepID=UPI001BD397A7|nr:uncharacterized protein LOC121517106 isoform X2 [Cheilinus undulatus]
MESLAEPVQTLLKDLKDNTNTFIFTSLIFSYQALKGEFPCICAPQPSFCYGYLFMPFFIVTTLMLATDARFGRVIRYTCWTCSINFSSILVLRSLKALCVGLLWIAAVFIDAEWYVCCMNENSRAVAELQCKEKKDVTSGGEPVVTINQMIINSRFYGMILLCGITFVGCIVPPFWRTFRATSYSACGDCQSLKCCSKEVDGDELMLEVGEELVSKAQREMKEKEINDKVPKGEWVDYLQFMEKMIAPVTGCRVQSNNQQNPEESVPLQTVQRSPSAPGGGTT